MLPAERLVEPQDSPAQRKVEFQTGLMEEERLLVLPSDHNRMTPATNLPKEPLASTNSGDDLEIACPS